MTNIAVESELETPGSNLSASDISVKNLTVIATRWWNRFMLLEVILYFTPNALIVVFQNSNFINDLVLFTYHPWKYAAQLLYGVSSPVAIENADDSPFAYFHFIASLIIYAIIAFTWMIIQRSHSPRTEKIIIWLWRNTLRIDLALLMICYGMIKFIPGQMPVPWPSELATPLGEQSNMDYLWYLMGFSPIFEITVGLIELIGGILLLIPRFITLGGYLTLITMIPVVMMDFSYDVNVKILPTQIVLGEMVLLWPELMRLVKYLILKRDLKAQFPPLIITTPKIWLRNSIICSYIILAILFIVNQEDSAWALYQTQQLDPHIPINGRWTIISTRATDPGLKPFMIENWKALDITALNSAEASTFLAEPLRGDASEQFSAIYANREIVLNHFLHLHYALSHNILTLTAEAPSTHRQIIFIRAKKAAPWPYHPDEFHWYFS